MERFGDIPRTFRAAAKIAGYVLVGGLFLTWLLYTPPGLLGKADAIGYAVCHRIDVRSFHLGERQLPLCTRCSGMYLGVMWGLLYQALRRPRYGGMPSKSVAIASGILAFAFAADGINSYLSLFPGWWHLYTPNNTLRLISGTGMGLVLAILIFPTFNQTVWSAYHRAPAMDGVVHLGLMLVGAAIIDALVLTENPLVLYPLALISAAGVLVVLTLVYTLILLMLIHHENRYNSFRELSFSLLAGFGLALLQIGALDVVRFLLTGTWEGFHLG